VRLERRSDPPSVVWRAITEREQLRSWFPCDVVVTGETWESVPPSRLPFSPEVIDVVLTGTVLAVEEPNMLAFTWGEETLRFELSPEDGGTLLVLIDELPASAAARKRLPAGRTASIACAVSRRQTPGNLASRLRNCVRAIVGLQEGPPDGLQGSTLT